MAGRISLVEEYENKDMIVQVKKCLDQTEAAVEASETARDVSIASAAEAHEASTNANSASAQAQTAAQTVSTYESRLGAVENESAGNRSSIQTIDGEITGIYNDLTNVIRKVGDPGQIVYNGLELRGTNRTSDTVVGELDDKIVNATRLIEEIDEKMNAYAQMVRTSGNQTVEGVKNFPYIIQRIYQSNTHIVQDADLTGTYSSQLIALTESTNDVNIFFMWHNTRKGIAPQVEQCGFISAGGRPSSLQMASIAGTVPSKQFAITRRVVNGKNEYRLWSTGQIKTIDILFEGIGKNNVLAWNRDASAIESSDLSTYDEVKYL